MIGATALLTTDARLANASGSMPDRSALCTAQVRTN